MKIMLAALFVFLNCTSAVNAQTPKEIISRVNKNFSKVQDYAADLYMNFAIPGINIEPIQGKVYFKNPDKFRIKTKGIVFLPKQNPYYALALLKDTNAYTAIITGSEKIGNLNCSVINIIPNAESDLILGKFWVDANKGLISKSQLTTKNNGTITIENTYGALSNYALPDKILFSIDVAKFKVPKAVAVDLNSKTTEKSEGSQKGIGTISLQFSKYLLNQKLKDEVFRD